MVMIAETAMNTNLNTLALKFYAFVDSYLFTGISNSAMYFKQKLMNVLSFSSPINVLIS